MGSLLISERKNELLIIECAVPSAGRSCRHERKRPGATVITIENAFALSMRDIDKISIAHRAFRRNHLKISPAIQMTSRSAGESFRGTCNLPADRERHATSRTCQQQE